MKPLDAVLCVTLPAALTETRGKVFNSPAWGMRALVPGEQVAIQQAMIELDTRLTRPAVKNRIRWHIGKLLNNWNSKLSDGEKEALLSDWVWDLRDFSEEHIFLACEKWRTTQRYKPQNSELLEILASIRAGDAEHLRRSRVLLGLEPPSYWEKPIAPAAPAGKDRPATASFMEKLAAKMRTPAARHANRQPGHQTRFEGPTPNIEVALAGRDPAAVEQLHKLRPIEKKA